MAASIFNLVRDLDGMVTGNGWVQGTGEAEHFKNLVAYGRKYVSKASGYEKNGACRKEIKDIEG